MKNKDNEIMMGANIALGIYFVIFVLSITIIMLISGESYVDAMVTIIVAIASGIGTKIALVLFTYLVEKEWYYD